MYEGGKNYKSYGIDILNRINNFTPYILHIFLHTKGGCCLQKTAYSYSYCNNLVYKTTSLLKDEMTIPDSTYFIHICYMNKNKIENFTAGNADYTTTQWLI